MSRGGLTLLELLLAISLMVLVVGSAAAWVQAAGGSLELHRESTEHARIRHALRRILGDDLLLAEGDWQHPPTETAAAEGAPDDLAAQPPGSLTYTVMVPRRGKVAVRWHFDRERGWLWRTVQDPGATGDDEEGQAREAHAQVVCGGLSSFEFTIADDALTARYRLQDAKGDREQAFCCYRPPGSEHDDATTGALP